MHDDDLIAVTDAMRAGQFPVGYDNDENRNLVRRGARRIHPGGKSFANEAWYFYPDPIPDWTPPPRSMWRDYPFLCRCSCHADPSSMHVVPCCHACPDCGAMIELGRMADHALICSDAARLRTVTVSTGGIGR